MSAVSSPVVSVIVAIYNAASQIDGCLRALCNQTLEDIEIICVDDGSTDSSGRLLDEAARRDSRITVVHQENGGAGAARNAGLALARGKYLSFLDVDDIFKKNMLERAVQAAESDSLDIAVFRADEFYPATGSYKSCAWSIHEDLLPLEHPFAGTDIPRDAFKLFIGWAWDKLFLADFIREKGLRFQEIRTTNDMLFVFSAIASARRIGVIHDVLIHHGKDEGSLSVTREKSWGCFYEALCALRQQLVAWDLFERFEQDYVNYCVHAALWNVKTLAEPTRTQLIGKLADSWAADLGIAGPAKDYFYHPKEYRTLMGLIEGVRTSSDSVA